MAHILIGWELGAYTGHIRRMLAFADAFEAAGHRVSFALQRLDVLAPELRGRFPCWQAPVWRRLLVSESRTLQGSVGSHADILARLGLDAPGMLSALLMGWDRILEAVAPDIVAAEYAPAMLRAAAGRIPTISLGTGFDLPPHDMDRFPHLGEAPVAADEPALLALANAELTGIGRPPLATLPGLFGADIEIACCFAELDPYGAWRTAALAPPVIAGPVPRAARDRGDEIFVYWPQSFLAGGALWDGLARCGRTIRIHAPTLTPRDTGRLAEAGFHVEPQPVPFDAIVARSALIVSHGGAGITSSALVAGVPMVVVPVDLEKMVQANAVATLGLGGWAAPKSIVAERFAADLGKLALDPDLATRARTASEDFRARMEPGPGAVAVAAVERLLAGA